MTTKIAFIKAAIIPNVVGRIDYMSNPERQKGKKEIKEKLLGFYQTPQDPDFWKNLAKHSQAQGKYHKGQTVVEAREFILQISNGIYDVASAKDHLKIAKEIAEKFKEKYGVEVAVAIHMNDDGTDYHAHILFSERVYIPGNPDREPAKRNTYFDENGKRSTKTACVDENGKLKKGCRLVKKGEMFPSTTFGPKIQKFADEVFLREEKERQAKYMTELCRRYNVKEEWIRYNHKTNPHMRLYNLKRGEPEALRAWKEVENEKIRAYNRVVDEMLAKKEITVEQALVFKEKIYEERRIDRERRAAAKDAYKKRYIECKNNNAEQRRKKKEEYEVDCWIRYREDGTPRNIFEGMIIFGMILCGVDLRQFACDWYGDDSQEDQEYLRQMELEERDTAFRIESSPFLQNMVDELARGAGRQSITEILAAEKAHRGLMNQIRGAEAQATASRTGDRIEPKLQPGSGVR